MIDSPLLGHCQAYVGGKWYPGAGGDTFTVTNPYDGATLAEMPALGERDVATAIDAAKTAGRSVPSLEARRRWLQGIHDLLVGERAELARIITLEHGKPLAEGEAEVAYAAGFFGFFARHVDELGPLTLEEQPKDCRWTLHHRPVGVVGLITPWNFPIAMLAKKLSAALAGGCPSVIKPASQTPLTVVALFELMDRELDLPPGMVNLVTGDASTIGGCLCSDPAVAMLSFTGSTAVGRKLIEQTAPQVKKLALELGGNAPFVVFEDADLEAAAEALVSNKFRASGQTCVCANRIYVQEAVAEPFIEAVARRVEALRAGNGMEEGVDVGPLIDRDGFDKVREHLADALERGARLVVGPRPQDLDPADGLVFPPTVVADVDHDMRCTREETFGPLVPIIRFREEAEAIERANATEMGLAAYLFTADANRAERTIAALEYGYCGWNTATGPTPEAPFGGVKQSGFGREGGREGLYEFVSTQTVPTPVRA